MFLGNQDALTPEALYDAAQVHTFLLIACLSPLVVGLIYLCSRWIERRRVEKQHENCSKSTKKKRATEKPSAISASELDRMQRAASDMTWLGIAVSVEGIWILAVVVSYFQDVSERFALLLNQADGVGSEMLILLIVRTLAWGSVAGTALYLLFRFSMSCFDQATRYRKRRTSAEVFNYMFAEHGKELDKNMTPERAVEIFIAWNAAIESAFTHAIPPRYKGDSAKLDADTLKFLAAQVGSKDGAPKPEPEPAAA